jgi:hypothetical protein
MDADTLRFFEGKPDAYEDTPVDWWRDARTVAIRSMRHATGKGLPGLLANLERARERATVQEDLACPVEAKAGGEGAR